MKRLCLFAGFHPKGEISDYVIYYIRELAQLADVYYMADCAMPETELAKLAPYVKGAWAGRHGKYDFGSWQELINKLGWDFVTQYDECIFANDSVFGPLFPLKPIFERTEQDSSLDAWAINAYAQKYAESYFYVLKRKVLRHEKCKQFFDSIVPQEDVNGVISRYEQGITQLLENGQFTYKVMRCAQGSLAENWRTFIKQGIPFLKVKNFTRAYLYFQQAYLPDWYSFLKKYTVYPPELITQHLHSIGVDPEQLVLFKFKLKSLYWCWRRWRRKTFQLHWHKREKLLILFGVTLFSNIPAQPPQVDEF